MAITAGSDITAADGINIAHGVFAGAGSTTGNDTYVITLTPAPAAYATYQVFRFIPDTANTGPCSLNVNGLGAKTIKKRGNVDLGTGDIVSGQAVEVMYDGTNFQLISPTAIQIYDFTTTASTTLQHSNDSAGSTTSATYVKVKEILLNEALPGSRIEFHLKNFSTIGNGRIYKNGSAIGTERSVNNSESDFSEDLTGFVSGDLIQIYAKATGGTTEVTNFRLKHDYKISKIAGKTLTTALPITNGPTETPTNNL